jgi:hypothetical protein
MLKTVTKKRILRDNLYLHSYLSKVEATSVDDLVEEQKSQLLVAAIGDFLDEKLSLDDLADIGSAIWFALDDKSSDLALAAEACSETNFNLRRVTLNKATLYQFAHYMWLLTTYHNAFKNNGKTQQIR